MSVVHLATLAAHVDSLPLLHTKRYLFVIHCSAGLLRALCRLQPKTPKRPGQRGRRRTHIPSSGLHYNQCETAFTLIGAPSCRVITRRRAGGQSAITAVTGARARQGSDTIPYVEDHIRLLLLASRRALSPPGLAIRVQLAGVKIRVFHILDTG